MAQVHTLLIRAVTRDRPQRNYAAASAIRISTTATIAPARRRCRCIIGLRPRVRSFEIETFQAKPAGGHAARDALGFDRVGQRIRAVGRMGDAPAGGDR
ncbi:MAG: hypothetical protein ACJ8GV_15615 [Luteimonas sp.]